MLVELRLDGVEGLQLLVAVWAPDAMVEAPVWRSPA